MMKMPKNSKSLMIALVLGLLFVLFFTQAVFAQEEVRLSASQETGSVGETVTVKISIANALQTEGGQFDLSYGPLLEPVSATRGDFVPDVSGNLFDSNLNLGDNKLRILWVTAAGSTKESGVVGTIVFRVVSAGETPLNFSDLVIAPPGRTVASTPGRVTGLVETAKERAIRAAEDLIAALPDPVDCKNTAHRTAVLNARAAVAEAKSLHGAVDTDFNNLSRLEGAERVIAKCDAIKAADDAIYALPSVERLTLNDKSKVEEARFLVNRAKTQHGAVDGDFIYLARLVAAENRIGELEGRRPTPPTGGAYYLLIGGSLILVAGTAAILKRRKLHT